MTGVGPVGVDKNDEDAVARARREHMMIDTTTTTATTLPLYCFVLLFKAHILSHRQHHKMLSSTGGLALLPYLERFLTSSR
jgi:hypothetical protein